MIKIQNISLHVRQIQRVISDSFYPTSGSASNVFLHYICIVLYYLFIQISNFKLKENFFFYIIPSCNAFLLKSDIGKSLTPDLPKATFLLISNVLKVVQQNIQSVFVLKYLKKNQEMFIKLPFKRQFSISVKMNKQVNGTKEYSEIETHT